MIWLAACGRYVKETRSIALGAVITDESGKAAASAMATVNARARHSKLDCGLMALALGADLAKANGHGAAAIWPSQSQAAASVCRSVSPGGTCLSEDYFRRDVRILAKEPEPDEKPYLDAMLASLSEAIGEDRKPEEDAGTAARLLLADRVLGLYERTPCGEGIRDADTVLKDFMDEADFEETGLGPELIRLWKGSTDKKSIEAVFELFAGRTFQGYLEECDALTSR